LLNPQNGETQAALCSRSLFVDIHNFENIANEHYLVPAEVRPPLMKLPGEYIVC